MELPFDTEGPFYSAKGNAAECPVTIKVTPTAIILNLQNIQYRFWKKLNMEMLMKTRIDSAVGKFLEGYNSAQAVVYSFCDDLHFDKDTALKLASGFGEGMGRMKEICGAISGGIIVIGLKYGEGQDQTFIEETYRKVQELMSRFELKYGSYLCSMLLDGCFLTTPEGQRYVIENNFPGRICKAYVGTVVEIVEDILSLKGNLRTKRKYTKKLNRAVVI